MSLGPGVMLTDNLMLERELGSGGMGSVWIAKNQALGSAVAVKVLRKEALLDAGQRQRFEQEARGLAQLDHPHLVKTFDYGITLDGEPYIVMELLRGEDLAQRIGRLGRLDLATTSAIVGQACKALARAHASGVVHRDIKPANLFLLEHDGDVFVKVLDFGIAKFAEGPHDMTGTGSLLGTPSFMSPEQLMNPRAIDGRTDVWALGVVVYACLTGKLPFEGETITALGMAVVKGHPPPPRQLRPDLPPAIDAWMTRALHTDMASRFQTVKELADALAVIAGAPPGSQPIVPATGTPQTHQQPWSQVSVNAATAQAPMPSPMAMPTPMPMAQAMPVAPVAAKSGTRPRWPLVIGGVVVLAVVVAGIGVLAGAHPAESETGESESSPADSPKKKKKKVATTATAAATTAERVEPTTAATTPPPAVEATAPPVPTSTEPGVPVAPVTAATGSKPAPTPTVAATSPPPATASTPPPAAPATAHNVGAGVSGVRTCWAGNEGGMPGTAATSVTVTVGVDAIGKVSSVAVSGPAKKHAGLVGCIVGKMQQTNFGPGPAESVSFGVDLPASKLPLPSPSPSP